MPTVSELIQQATQRTDQTSAQADAFLVKLLNLASIAITTGLPEGYNYNTVPEIEFPVFSAVAPSINASVAPFPDAPPATAFSSIENVTVPELTATAPTLDLPALPSATLPTAPSGAPEFVQPDIPSAPVITLPAVPTFASLALPEAPSLTMPSFEGSLPVDDLLVPSNTFAFHEAAYESALLDGLKAKLLADLQNGGYGIEVADESALFQRARDRDAEAMMTRIDGAGREMAARGFPLPPGILQVHIDAAYQEFQNKSASIGREIFLDSSKRFVDNRRFTIEQIHALQGTLIGFHNSVNERALNVARYTVELGLAVYNGLVARYQAKLEAFRVEATAFAERVRGELAKAEIYRVQVQAAGLAVDMQKTLVDVYRAQLAGIETSANIFKVQVEAANVRASIERQKLEAFRSHVEAYTAQVQSKVAEFSMYRAGVDGQRARQDIYAAQVQAFATQVQAAKTRSDMSVSRLQGEVEQARVKLASYQAQVEAFKGSVQNHLESGRLSVDLFRAHVDKARAETDGHQANAQLRQTAILATGQQNTDISRVQVENARVRVLAAVEDLKNRTSIVQYGTEKFYGQLLAQLNAIQSLAVQTSDD